MHRIIPEPLRSTAESAATAGLGFLGTVVEEGGIWPIDMYRFGEPQAGIIHSLFAAATGALVLEPCDDDRAESIRSRSRGFLLSCIEHPGLWSDSLPDGLDLDSTALCSLAIGPRRHPWIFLGRNVDPILSCRDADGQFLTWMNQFGPLGRPNDTDPVVNANVIAYLGDRTETRPVQHWIARLVAENREAESSIWYSSPLDLYYGVSRAACIAAPAFAGLRATLANRIPSARLEDALRTAQALSSLDMLGDFASSEFVLQCAERLIDMQLPHGGWEACEVWRGPRGLGLTYRSQALTTAYCIEALTRLAKH